MDAQRSFDFAIALHRAFDQRIGTDDPSVRRGTYGINATLADYLGEAYKEFCKTFKDTYPGKNEVAYFKKEFLQKPFRDESAVLDWEILSHWGGLSSILSHIKTHFL